MKVHIFWGELTDISAKKQVLIVMYLYRSRPSLLCAWYLHLSHLLCRDWRKIIVHVYSTTVYRKSRISAVLCYDLGPILIRFSCKEALVLTCFVTKYDAHVFKQHLKFFFVYC